MLSAALFAHEGRAVVPHDVLTAWNADPLTVIPLALVGWLWWRGWRPRAEGRARGYAFVGGMVAVALAVLSPVDAIAEVLVSAHMVQHLLFVLVAAPLLAWAAPGAALWRGIPPFVRLRLVRARRAAGIGPYVVQRFRHPVGRWLAAVGTFWVWHASVLYAAAVEHRIVHLAEHVTFLATAVLAWACVVGPARVRLSPGLGVLFVFALTLQAGLLSALMTFARRPWYEPYAVAAPGWGLEPLADQQLAGVIMWVPAGSVHAVIGIVLLLRWLRQIDTDDRRPMAAPAARPARHPVDGAART